MNLDTEETNIAAEHDRLQALILSNDTAVKERTKSMARVGWIDERIDQIPVEEAQLAKQHPRVELVLREYRERLVLQG